MVVFQKFGDPGLGASTGTAKEGEVTGVWQGKKEGLGQKRGCSLSLSKRNEFVLLPMYDEGGRMDRFEKAWG